MASEKSIYALRYKGDQPLEVVDLFCGIGGLSYGLKRMGFRIRAGFDFDSTCEYAYSKNNKAQFIYKDIRDVCGEEIKSYYSPNSIKILAGCAPCQPFSSYSNKKKKDPNKFDLLYQFGRLIDEVNPDIVTMENVANIVSFKLKPVFADFLECLHRNDYHVFYQKVYCPDYGIPQTRKRLVLLASRYGDIRIIGKTCPKDKYHTVQDAIGNLPFLEAGGKDPHDPLHRARTLTNINLERIQATPYGGGWRDWPAELLLECHKRDGGRSFGSVYGRMRWEEPGPTMTTECTGIGNGRFGHPQQDRAISPREAALLQTFPMYYRFFPDEESVAFSKASRYIGNAVPPRLGMAIGASILEHLRKNNIIL
jgi:DNA (cytosine-5)-methyltransferase 1